jgi:hypothetical protein
MVESATAHRDLLRLAAVINSRADVAALFVMSLRIFDFLAGRAPLRKGCLVCAQVPTPHWPILAYNQYEYVDMHCPAHAQEFHAACRHHFICCVPPYHPDSHYEWREEGEALLALQSPEQPDLPSAQQ